MRSLNPFFIQFMVIPPVIIHFDVQTVSRVARGSLPSWHPSPWQVAGLDHVFQSHRRRIYTLCTLPLKLSIPWRSLQITSYESSSSYFAAAGPSPNPIHNPLYPIPSTIIYPASLPVYGHLDCFHCFAVIKKNASMNNHLSRTSASEATFPKKHL